MNETKKRKVVLVGVGFVGMSMAFSLFNTGGIDELVLIDIDQKQGNWRSDGFKSRVTL